MRTAAFTTLAALALAACAQSPDAIAPVSMGGAYSGLTCTQASAQLAAEQQTLATLSAAQNNAVAGDAIGVFLIGVPMSSLTGGNKAGDIGAAKGKIMALEARLTAC